MSFMNYDLEPEILDVEERHFEKLPKDDMVNHPKHYNAKNGLEAIDVIEAFTDGLDGIYAVDTANAIKYILRWKDKNGIEDLKKARWYINHLINKLEGDR